MGFEWEMSYLAALSSGVPRDRKQFVARFMILLDFIAFCVIPFVKWLKKIMKQTKTFDLQNTFLLVFLTTTYRATVSSQI